MHNANINAKCEWRLLSGEQCSFPNARRVKNLQRPCVWRDSTSEKTFAFGLIAKCGDSFCRIHSSHLYSEEWNHSYTHSMCSIFSAFAFVIRFHITHKWNVSLRLKGWIKYNFLFLCSSGSAVCSSVLQGLDGWILRFYVLATTKVIPVRAAGLAAWLLVEALHSGNIWGHIRTGNLWQCACTHGDWLLWD